MDQNLAWLTQKTEDPKSNKGNLIFSTHIVSMIEMQNNEKSGRPPISTSTPPLQVCPPPIFGRSYPPLIRGGGGCPTMSEHLFDQSNDGNTGTMYEIYSKLTIKT